MIHGADDGKYNLMWTGMMEKETKGKTLLGITGSYRKKGNSELVIRAMARSLGREEDLELIRLASLDIRPCKGCYACLLPGVSCNIHDDMEWLLEQMARADALIFAVPDYVLGPVGILKMAADRTLQAGRYRTVFEKIPVVAALTLGREDYRGYADTALISQVSTLGFRVLGLGIFHGTHPGEAVLADGFADRIAGLARLLADGSVMPPQPGRCPRCYSDLFRVRNGKLECALCKAEGTLEGEDISFSRFPHEFSPEGLMEHMKWLLMKKQEFAGMRDRLKTVQNEYGPGRWLMPERGSSDTDL